MTFELSPMERKRVPGDVPKEVVFGAREALSRERIKPADAVQVVAAEMQKLERMPLTPEQKTSGRTYLNFLQAYVRLPGEKARAGTAPFAIRERKLEENGLNYARMNQDFMFLLRRLRTQSPETLDEMHANLEELSIKFPGYMNRLEHYENFKDGVVAELATMEVFNRIGSRYHLNSVVTKLTPEDDIGKNDSKQKIDFDVTTPGGIKHGWQVKSESGKDQNFIETRHAVDGAPEIFIGCHQYEDFFDLTTGEHNDSFEKAIVHEYVDVVNKNWRF